MSLLAHAPAPDQTGRTALITGANSGIGFETARALAHAGADVVLACRDDVRARAACAAIEAERPAGRVTTLQLDLASLASVRRAVDQFRKAHDALDLLINNAGLMAIPRSQTEDGFEMHFGVNHLGHFALTGLLLDAGFSRKISRVVTVSSVMHHQGAIDFADLDQAKHYRRWDAYRQSKLANLLFSYELDRRLRACGLPTLSIACHPGYVATNLFYVAPTMRGSRSGVLLHRAMSGVFAQTAACGALPTLHAAAHKGVSGGDFIGPDGFLELRGVPTKLASSQLSHDRTLAARLWQVSLERTGVPYTALERTKHVRKQAQGVLV